MSLKLLEFLDRAKFDFPNITSDALVALYQQETENIRAETENIRANRTPEQIKAETENIKALNEKKIGRDAYTISSCIRFMYVAFYQMTGNMLKSPNRSLDVSLFSFIASTSEVRAITTTKEQILAAEEMKHTHFLEELEMKTFNLKKIYITCFLSATTTYCLKI